MIYSQPSAYTIRMPALWELPDIGNDEAPLFFKACDQIGIASHDYQLAPTPITQKTPVKYRRAVHRCAQYFQREFGYDFVQYGFEGRDPDPSHRAFLWTGASSHPYTVIGACCFRWREYRSSPHAYALQWAWLHPYERRKGVLTACWPFFVARFGEFSIEAPHSPAMQAFIRKNAPWYT